LFYEPKEAGMGLPRTFVGFSSTDIHCYHLMTAWKNNENIDFDFADCQLDDEINSDDEDYIKSKCRKKINLASKFILLIGEDTRSKHKYVRWETEVAIEKECVIIGVNLDHSRRMVEKTCPPIIRDIGVIFVTFSPYIIKHAIEKYAMHESSNYYYPDEIYKKLGYT
jgi:hypothetical protein